MLNTTRRPPGCAREWTAAVRPAVGRACTGAAGSPPHLIVREGGREGGREGREGGEGGREGGEGGREEGRNSHRTIYRYAMSYNYMFKGKRNRVR